MFFKAALRGKNDWWRYLITIIAICFAYVLGQTPMYYVLGYKIKTNDAYDFDMLDEFAQNPDFSMFGINRNLGFLLLLLMFVVAFMVLLLMLKHVHKKDVVSLITPTRSINWKKILFGFWLWFSMSVIIEGIFYFTNPEAYTFHFNLSTFLILLLISVFILPIQTTFEELVFRGYLLQGLGLVFKNRWAPLLATCFLFGLIHAFNPEIEKYGFITMEAYYISAALILGIMTIMDNSLELAIGVHAATNIFAACFVGYEGAALQTDTLLKTKEINPQLMLLAMLLLGIVFLFICSKKYNWTSFRKLLKPINFEDDSTEAEISSTPST